MDRAQTSGRNDWFDSTVSTVNWLLEPVPRHTDLGGLMHSGQSVHTVTSRNFSPDTHTEWAAAKTKERRRRRGGRRRRSGATETRPSSEWTSDWVTSLLNVSRFSSAERKQLSLGRMSFNNGVQRRLQKTTWIYNKMQKNKLQFTGPFHYCLAFKMLSAENLLPNL